uniref:Uncharacterized protein n=1 Tax=Cannabis sativa TaxID=3483 RepID=A0A803P1V6_CANSA
MYVQRDYVIGVVGSISAMVYTFYMDTTSWIWGPSRFGCWNWSSSSKQFKEALGSWAMSLVPTRPWSARVEPARGQLSPRFSGLSLGLQLESRFSSRTGSEELVWLGLELGSSVQARAKIQGEGRGWSPGCGQGEVRGLRYMG